MRKNNTVPLRSALESFHGIKQHLKDTNQLFDSLESKIIEINKETKKKLKKPSQKLSKAPQKQTDRLASTFSSSKFDTTAYRSDQKSPNRRFFASNVTSPEYRQPKAFAREELYDYNQRTLSQKNSPGSVSRFYHSEIKNLLDEKYRNRDLYQSAREEPLINPRIEINREEKLRRNKDQIKALEEEIKHREESRGTFVPDEHAPRKSANTQELENFYQLKLVEIQSHIAANDSEISRLTTVNQNLKAEMANIKNLLEAETQFEKDCNKIYNGAVETFGSPQLENDLDIKRRIKLEKYNSQRQASNEHANQSDKENDDENEQNTKELQESTQQAAQMNAIFELVSKYQVDMEQIKRDNLLVQEKLQQEILELKDQLLIKQNQDKPEEEVEEQHEEEERPSHQRSSIKKKSQVTDYFEVMEKDDLAKYAKGLQETYTALEQQHLEAIEENKRLKRQLITANESEVYQHESNLYYNDDDHPHHQESGQSLSRKSLEKWDEYQQKLRATPLNNHEYPHKHLSPIKDSSEKDYSKFLIPTPNRKEIPTEFSDLRANLRQSPQKPKPKKNKKSNLNSSFEDADEFMDQITKAKELIQSKIAQNDAEISDEEDVAYPSKRMCQTADNFGKKNKKKVAQKDR